MKKRLKKKSTKGFFAALCDKLSERFSSGLVSSLSGGYRKYEDGMENSFLIRKLNEGKKGRLKLRLGIASQFESSAILRWRASFLKLLTALPVKAYAAFFLAFAIISSLIRILICYIKESFIPSEFLFASVLTYSAVIVTFPLFFSEHSLSELLKESRIFERQLTGSVGILPERLGRPPLGRGAVSVSVSAGVVCGLLSVVMTPDKALSIVLLILFLAFLTDYPETGIKLLIPLTPFLSMFERPSLMLGILFSAVVAGWGAKLLRGRRSLYPGLSDIPVVLLTLSMILSGITNGSDFSVSTALLQTALIFGYFACANLIRSRSSLTGAAAAITVSATAVSFIGIFQYVSGGSPLDWLDLSSFPGITGRTVSLLDNPNMLAVFLSMAFPCALYFVSKGSGRERIAGTLSAASIAVCSVLTWSRSGWIGLAAGFAAFMLFESPRGLIAVPLAAGATGVAAYLFPDTLGARLAGMFSLSDTANSYRVKVWNGAANVAKHFLFTGAGAGDIVFGNVYLLYGEPGTYGVPHSHSLWLQLIIQAGIPALIFFIAAALLLLSKAVTFMREGRAAGDNKSAALCAAFISGCLTVLVSGCFDHTLYNYRIFFIFCCLAGLASASADCCRRSAEELELAGGPLQQGKDPY